MVVWNSHRTTAVVIRHDGLDVRLVPMRSGRLKVCRYTRSQFDAEWREHDCPLVQAHATFLNHAQQQGATVEAMRGLVALAQRDAPVIRPLF